MRLAMMRLTMTTRAGRALAATVLLSAARAAAQDSKSDSPPPPPIQPNRPTVANSAGIARAGTLQLELGFSGYRHASRLHDQWSVPAALRYSAGSRVQLSADVETYKRLSPHEGVSETGVGDTWVGAKAVAVEDAKARPGVAVGYFAKLPTASQSKGLGTGRV